MSFDLLRVFLDDRVGEVGRILGDRLQHRQHMAGRGVELLDVALGGEQEGGELLGRRHVLVRPSG